MFQKSLGTLCRWKKGRRGRKEGRFHSSILPFFHPSILPFLPFFHSSKVSSYFLGNLKHAAQPIQLIVEVSALVSKGWHRHGDCCQAFTQSLETRFRAIGCIHRECTSGIGVQGMSQIGKAAL
jgi:hypothetical protein